MNKTKVELLIKELLLEIGEDPKRDGLKKTPARVAEMWEFLTSGYTKQSKIILNDAVFQIDSEELVLVKDIEFYSLCEHHLLPFIGKVHVGYIPNGKVIGLSKIARIVDMFAQRLQLQERLSKQIAEELLSAVQAQGVGVMIESQHLCMSMRGVEKIHAQMLTTHFVGLMKDCRELQDRMLSLITK